jgi:biopolymer transport protein ExbB/TolQ
MDTTGLAHDIEQVIFTIAKLLLYPVLIAAIACLIWVLVELGYFFYEVYLRVRFRDLDALEIRTLRAREAFNNGQPRKAYRYLQENNYSMVVVRFLFDLIRNYQGQRLAEKPLKLLQEYEFYTIKRLEKTRILVRVGPMLGLMGTLIPLAPALEALANNDTAELANQLEIAFSVTVIGLLIGGLAFTISILRDRFYSQDISDLEYLLELLEGGPKRLRAGRRKDTEGRWVDELEPSTAVAADEPDEGAPEAATAAAVPTAAAAVPATVTDGPAAAPATVDLPANLDAEPAGQSRASFEDDTMSWNADEDPFASLGPAEDAKSRG